MPLVLDLVRHGQAEPSSPEGDGGRKLTQHGALMIQALGDALAAAGSTPTHVFSSPLVRAVQSARILADIAAPGIEIETLEGLRPEASPRSVIDALEARRVIAGHAIVVGHMPQLGELHLLLTGESVAFAVATLRRITFSGAASANAGRPTALPRP